MSKEIDKIYHALENMSITFDELGFAPTIPIPKGDKTHFVDWFSFEIEMIKAVSQQQDQRIAELEEQLKGCIRPKFNRQEHICGFAFGEIREYVVVAYLDNNITLCENIETNELEWCDNNFLVRAFEEAQAKLKELQGE